jgi:hypothetical protein
LIDTRFASLGAREFRFAVIVGEGAPCQVAPSSTEFTSRRAKKCRNQARLKMRGFMSQYSGIFIRAAPQYSGIFLSVKSVS